MRGRLCRFAVAVGAILWALPALAQSTTSYTYDALGRLTSAATPAGTITYNYDAAGNRTSVTTATGSLTTIQVTGSGPVNLRSLANAAGYNGAQNATITFVVASGTTITGSSGGGIAIDSGTWPTGSYTINLTLQISGNVYGGGGIGGQGAKNDYSGTGTAGTGGNGGDAIDVRLPMTINVLSGGQIKAGGGGGGGGGFGWINGGPSGGLKYGGGGGGGGFPDGAGGSGGSGVQASGASGSSGTASSGGNGGSATSPAGSGGGGGGAGAVGATGANGYNAFGGQPLGATGGSAGYAIRKNGNAATVTNGGTIVGQQG